ncbi:hypothetical protein acsn021_03030 [Anaerocolumna cellulosilytica]|uniref:Uncharacterized protein n=1 Tax=Anaerocolumna cellulosilytica TaxID=433286 RepID=A0A6S6QQ71_9FIRM|nr:helix-turn-helix transcriptional regulator [Anaerocolumna cellulosilytica]MBB5197292.1 transcriptional regulator with XRE-family HTH domain [Anaerocolumna cellulosilytica]BCJ92734.1 hypothetical protein acsn021_03030 [Anaerocolumna cellulosilytica]
MNYEHFGAFLQDLRIQHNLSREKLAENICTSKQIYRIEKGLSEPSLYLITQLSIKFNMDLHEYFKMYFTNNTIAGLEGINAINSAIETFNIPLLKSLVEKYEKLEDFKKGENLQHIYYGKALCSALLDRNYETSLEFCFSGIQIECPNFDIANISKNMYSNVAITLMNCIGQNCFALNQYDSGKNVFRALIIILEKFAINSPYPFLRASQFSKKMYQLVLNNIAYEMFDNGEIKEALNYIEKGITFSLKEYNLRHLANLIYMKFKILYHEQNYEEAKEYYNRTIYLYKITNKDDKLTELEQSARIEYPEIFTD